MRVLLVTWIDKLAEKLAALSPELDYCAIIVDDIEPAREILEQVGLSPKLLYPMKRLKNASKVSIMITLSAFKINSTTEKSSYLKNITCRKKNC